MVEDDKGKSVSLYSSKEPKEFEWNNKARKIVEIYEKCCLRKPGRTKNKLPCSKNTVPVQTDRT